MGLKIWEILKKILPASRIGAWILGVAAAALAMLLGVNNADLKEKFCAAAPVELPKIEVKAAEPAPVVPVTPQPEAKK